MLTVKGHIGVDETKSLRRHSCPNRAAHVSTYKVEMNRATRRTVRQAIKARLDYEVLTVMA